jgi:predicted transcriptional regulator
MNEELAANIGFIMGNKQRERIVQALGSKGDISAEKIAKFEHIPLNGVKKTLSELAEKRIVSKKGEIWSLTDIGKEIEKELKKRT